MDAHDVVLCFVTLMALAAAVSDLRTGHIPNWLSVGGIALGAALRLATHCADHGDGADGALWASLAALGGSAAGVLVCGLTPYLLFLQRAMGGGDVKLLAACGAALGPMPGLEVELYAFGAASLYALARLSWDGRIGQLLGNVALLVAQPLRATARRAAPVPLASLRFAPAVLAGVLVVVGRRWAGP